MPSSRRAQRLPGTPVLANGSGRSTSSLFDAETDFCAAVAAEGHRSYVVTADGRFRAGLTRIALDRLHLCGLHESLPRVSFIEVPDDKILSAFALDAQTRQVWGGCPVDANELVLVAPGRSIHARTEGPSFWGIIWFPFSEFSDYARSLLGDALVVPDVMGHWRPRASAIRRLRMLHKSAMRAAQLLSASLTEAEAIHGLEQELIEALMDALATRCIGVTSGCASGA